jgi:hypothetical protein
VRRVDAIYDKYVKELSASERLELLALVAKDLAMETIEPSKGHPRNIMDLHGLGKEIWNGIDAQDYVNKLREEWDDRS